jgi:hypothetical protein
MDVHFDGFTPVLEGLPGRWKYRLGIIRYVLWGFDLSLSVFGTILWESGNVLGSVMLGVAFALLLSVEIGRSRIQLEPRVKGTTEFKSVDDGGAQFAAFHPLRVYYIDEDGERVSTPSEKRELGRIEVELDEDSLSTIKDYALVERELEYPIDELVVSWAE